MIRASGQEYYVLLGRPIRVSGQDRYVFLGRNIRVSGQEYRRNSLLHKDFSCRNSITIITSKNNNTDGRKSVHFSASCCCFFK